MKSIQLFLLVFCLNANVVHAHAVITHTSLNTGSIIADQATQVELTFNSKVELNLSQIMLVSAGDITQALETSPGGKPGTIIIKLPALTSGDYAIQLKIFAADGHLSEDLLRFSAVKEIR